MSINNIGPFTKSHLDMCIKNNSIDDALYEKYGVKRSLRDLNGIGINAGITNVSLSKSLQQMKTATVFHVPESSTIAATKFMI